MWHRLMHAAIVLTVLLAPATGISQETEDGDAVVENAWAPAAQAGGTGTAYFTIRNIGSEPLRIIDVRSDHANIVTLHKTAVDSKGIVRMSAVPQQTIQPGEALTLAPGAIHVMLLDVEKSLVEGEILPMRLKFYDRDELQIYVPILESAARGPEG